GANNVENSEISTATTIQKPTIFICPWCVLYSSAVPSDLCSFVSHPPRSLFSVYDLFNFSMVTVIVIGSTDEQHDDDTHQTDNCNRNPFKHQRKTGKEHYRRHDEWLP